MKKNAKKWLLLLMLGMLAFGLTACGGQNVSNLNGSSVKPSDAKKQPLKATLDITGVLVPNQTVNVAAKTGGKLASINVNVGSVVTAGEILATIDTTDLNAQMAQAQAALNTVKDQADQANLNLIEAQAAYQTTQKLLSDQEEQAKINMDAAQKAYNNIKQLVAVGSASQSQLDDAQSKYDLAKKQFDMASLDSGSSAQNQLLAAKSKVDLAQKQYDIASGSALAQAQAAVNSIQVQLDNAIIKSPISGIVLNKNINAGEIASPGVAILTIADNSILKLKGTVPQENLPMLQVGQKMRVSIDIYPNKAFDGQIDTIGPMAVSTGEYFPIEISIPNSGDLRAGLTAHANVK